jgi:primosomal protein N' (replication factor Y)
MWLEVVNIHQPLLKFVVENNFEGFYEKEILEREKFNYPPFTRLVLIICKCEDKELNFKAANELALDIRGKLGNIRVLGPESPPIGRINNLYHHHILLKLETAQINIKAVKDDLLRGRARIIGNKDYRKVSVIINVDP